MYFWQAKGCFWYLCAIRQKITSNKLKKTVDFFLYSGKIVPFMS